MYVFDRIRYRGFYKRPINSKIFEIENNHNKVLYFYYSQNEYISDLDIGENLRIGDSLSKKNNSSQITVYRPDTTGYRFYKAFIIK